MGGPEVLAAPRRVDPGVRVALMTGGSGSGLDGLGAFAVVNKPFPIRELVGLVRGLLGVR